MRLPNLIAAAMLAGITASAAMAHHSFAAFYREHPAALAGTVKGFLWTNPHTQLSLMVPDGKGGSQQWDLEGGSVNGMMRQGLSKAAIPIGAKVKVLIAPRHDGQPGGEFQRIIEMDGKPFGSGARG